MILLTAKTRQMDRVAGLDAGADDYLPKPFGPEELLARIRAVLRRIGPAGSKAIEPNLEVDGISLIPGAREVRAEGVAVGVTSIEYEILEFLVRSAGRTVTREALTAAIYRRQGLAVRPGAGHARQQPPQEARPSRRFDPHGPGGGLSLSRPGSTGPEGS